MAEDTQKPYSGNTMLRMEVHARAARAAELAGKSMNQWSEALDAAAKAARVA